MFNFTGKIVETPKHTPGKRISAKVIWRGKFMAKVEKEYFNIEGEKDLTDCVTLYALPTNRMVSCWSRKPCPVITDPDALAMTLRFWGKYFSGMTIYGKIIDNIFVESKHKNNEPNLSETTEESISNETVHTVVRSEVPKFIGNVSESAI